MATPSRLMPHTPLADSPLARCSVCQAVGVIHPGNVESELIPPEERERRRETEGYLAAEDVAASVLHMASLPLSASVLEMTVLPTQQPFVGRG